MSVCKEEVLDLLPPYRDQWVLVAKDQVVSDIMADIVDKHKRFEKYYDKIALCFDADNTEEICSGIQSFIKENIVYKEETKDRQTTALPTGILMRGYGDCKHYASFSGGILDALNRVCGKKIDWCYRFASYKLTRQTPYHVFVVVKDGNTEYWIDPVPGAEKETPVWYQDRHIKNSGMSNVKKMGYVTVGDIMAGTDSAFADLAPVQTPATSGGSIDPTSAILTSVLSLFSGIFNSIGDHVPDYPIKSQNTLQGILTNIKQLFPADPVNLADAQAQLARAQKYSVEAYAKGGDVNTTYGMLYDKVAATLQNYIATHGGGGTTTVLTNSAGVPIVPPTPAKDNTLLYVGLGLGSALLFFGNKKSVVSGISNTNLFLIAGGVYLLYEFVLKPKTSVTDVLPQRTALIGWINADNTTSDSDKLRIVGVFNSMSAAEIADTYNFVFNYMKNGTPVPPGTPLYNSMIAISSKYNIFS